MSTPTPPEVQPPAPILLDLDWEGDLRFRGAAGSVSLVLDSDGQVSSSYGVESIPTQVLVDRRGRVRHVQVGVSPALGDEMSRRIEELKKS